MNSKQKRRDFIKTVSTAGIASMIPASVYSKEMKSLNKYYSSARPNIVIMISDDQSSFDLGCYGNNVIQTPNIDKLASEGMKFTRAYVSCPQCSPSRGSLLTGRFPHSTSSSRLHIPVLPEIPTIINLLKENGYFTGAYRKTHQPLIQEQFDFYGNDEEPFNSFFEKRPKEKPFFLWFGSNEPHRPPQGYESSNEKISINPNDISVPEFLPGTKEVRMDMAYYYDRLNKFDFECGEIIKLLEKNNLIQNTIVIVTSDNGMPFPRAKATLYESGIKVPLIIKWSSKIPANKVSNELVSLIDLAPTVLEASETNYEGTLDGKSILPLITNKDHKPAPYIFSERNWHDNWQPSRCIISDKYKLIMNFRLDVGYLPALDIKESLSYSSILKLKEENKLKGNLNWYKNNSTPFYEFYNLEKDPFEWKNEIDNLQYAKIIDEMKSALSDWMINTYDFLPSPKHSYGYLNYKYENIEPLNGTQIK
ncbi:MAG: sulfatase [Ignavibacterium sp.]